ncbi:hypothetical protein [Hydrogenophaga sp. BPS33]|uniref:hypothetical protein n=1 Tax=Hydrogenophaga sp. BPS33 TaxID=2651974 RepID=UPI00131FCCC6|nr:hypothetical protein [Hydrogenophaga sp. BPS33]QHE84516.1 hypothetical protein F9K07_06250 [Hydrogenophaga sp. BPS33]
MASKKPVRSTAQQQKQLQQHLQPTRARSPRTASAQSSSPPPNAATPPPTMAQCIAWSGNVRDHVADLSEAFMPYLVLERFVSPEYADEVHADVPASRGELGAMLRNFNAAIQQQLDMLANAATVFAAQMAGQGQPGSDSRSG